MLIGYARVSTQDQNLDLQIEALTKSGCKKVFDDKISGSRAERPGLAKALEMGVLVAMEQGTRIHRLAAVVMKMLWSRSRACRRSSGPRRTSVPSWHRNNFPGKKQVTERR